MMHKRIHDLALQAGGSHYPTVGGKTLEKFAELIVRECVDRVTSKANEWGDMTGFAIKESILGCAKDLKQHFGVEE
jgi:hypothetical protein